MGNHPGPDDPRLAASLRASWPSEPPCASSTPSILVVDDDGDCRTICRTILEHVGFGVQEAVDGWTALQMMRRTPPDLLILDLSLPVMDGWEVAREMRADPHLRRIPIMVLTAHAMEATRRQSLEVGCDRYLVKPISPLQLVREVEWFLTPPQPRTAPKSPAPNAWPMPPGRF